MSNYIPWYYVYVITLDAINQTPVKLTWDEMSKMSNDVYYGTRYPVIKQ